MNKYEILQNILDDKVIVHLATVSDKGIPQSTPVWVDIDKDTKEILFNIQQKSVKARNLKKGSRIAFSIYDPTDLFLNISVQGIVVNITSEGAIEHQGKMSKKYRGEEWENHKDIKHRLLVTVKPTEVSTFGF